MSTPRLLPALLVMGMLSAPAYAADVTAAQADALQEQLRAWLASLTGPAVDVGKEPMKVTADGDHFNVVLPAPLMLSQAGFIEPGMAITMKAKPLEGGRFALDDLKYPTPLKLMMPAGMIPVTPPDSPLPGGMPTPPSMADLAKGAELSYSSMDFHAVLDPTYATTSSFDSATTGFHFRGPNSDSTAARTVGHSIWQPVGDGHINIISEGMTEKSAGHVESKDGNGFDYTIASSRSSSKANAVSPASLAALIRSVSALVPTLQDTQESLNPEQRALARTAVFALRDMFGGIESHETMDKIVFTAAGHTASIASAGLAARMGVEDGKLLVANDITLQGFDSPEVPAGVYRDFLPRRFVLKPRISGIPSEDLVKLLLRAIDSSQADLTELQDAAIGLLGAGPLEVAIDELALDLGRASLSGTGSLDIASPTDIAGEAEITVVGLDTMIKAANTTPELKQGAPVLIFLKGIGRQEGDKTIWDIKYEDSKVTVNDTDLSDLMPQPAPPPPPPVKSVPRNRPTPKKK